MKRRDADDDSGSGADENEGGGSENDDEKAGELFCKCTFTSRVYSGMTEGKKQMQQQSLWVEFRLLWSLFRYKCNFQRYVVDDDLKNLMFLV